MAAGVEPGEPATQAPARGPAVEEKCERHGVATLLRCAQCEKAVCPKCVVWTVVGQKCADCVGRKPLTAKDKARRLLLPGLILLGLLAVVVGVRYLTSGSFQRGTVVAGPSTFDRTRTFDMGQAAADGDVDFVVNGFRCGDKTIGSGPGARTAVGRFCFLELSMRNSGGQPVLFSPGGQFLKDEDDRTYGADPRAMAQVPGNGGFTTVQQLNPGIEIQGVLVYDVPPDVAPQFAELHRGPEAIRGPASVPSRGVRVRLPTT